MTQLPFKKNVLGYWRIVWMEQWDQEYVDLIEPGFIRIDSDGEGEFQFGVITGSFHTIPENTYFDSMWEGAQEWDEARGEICGTVNEDCKEGVELCGTITFWEGDESEYRAAQLNPNRSAKEAN